MTDQEINQTICTQILNWTLVEGSVYQDTAGTYVYAADYCNSIPHSMDLAKANEIALKPTVDGWTAYKLSDETALAADALASKAICLCLTTMPTPS
jgi:hypothetical protein